jgi:methionine-rich copper-binding protein CopC
MPLALVMLLCGMAGARAHVFLDHAAPPVGGTVHGPPARVTLWFTQRIEPAFSTVRVVDRDGRRVDKGDRRVDGADGTRMTATLPALPAGRYRVFWRVVSVDTHVTEGDFTFEVTR